MLRPLLIFDLDGTLIDSAADILDAANFARLNSGFTAADPLFIQDRIGLPAKYLFEDLELRAEPTELLILKFRERLSELIERGSKLFPDVSSFLLEAKNLEFNIAVATNKPLELANKVVLNSELRKVIDFVAGIGNLPPKPAPDMILKCLEKFQTDEAIMVGDRKEDVKAAKLAGVIAVGITQSSHSHKDLKESGADYVFEDFGDLYKHCKLNKWRF